MSKVIGFVVGAVMLGAGVITGNPTLALRGAMILFASTANALLTPDAPARQAQEAKLKVGETPRKALFGEFATAGDLADAFNFGGKYGTDCETLVIDLADHRCDALVGFYVNDVYVPFTGDGLVSGFNSQLEVHFYPGTEDQGLWSRLVTEGGWSPNDTAKGVCRVVVTYTQDKEDQKDKVWPGGRPSFLWVVRGLRCYDPRKDSTVPGGSGSHRWDDPETREWSDNAEICRYNYDRGIYACDRVDQPDQLMIGRGLSATEAPPEAIFAAANLCDEDVSLAAGGTEKRYRAGGVVYANEEFGEIELAFAAAMGGIVIQPEGGIGVEPGHAKSTVAEITDRDLVAGEKIEFEDFRSEADDEWVNTVTARYVEPSQKWGDHSAPIRRNSADVTADGGPREAQVSLRFVTSGTQAQRIAEIRRRQGRLLKTAQITLGPRFAGIEDGDWIGWTSQRYLKGARVVFRVDSYSLAKTWRNTLSLREMSANCFFWSVSDEIADGTQAESQNPPDYSEPSDASDWLLTGETLSSASGSIPALVITRTGSPTTNSVAFEYRTAGSARIREDSGWVLREDGGRSLLETDEPGGWISAGIDSPGLVRKEITSVTPGTSYQVAIRDLVGGTMTDRLILGPVTVGDLAANNTEVLGGEFDAGDIMAIKHRLDVAGL